MLLSICCFGVNAQQLIKLKNRSFTPEQNIETFNPAELAKKNSQFEGKSFVVIQFLGTLSDEKKQQLTSAGIELHQYVPDNAFTSVINGVADLNVLSSTGAVSIFELDASDKISSRLAMNKIPGWAIKEQGKVDVIVHFNSAITSTLAKEYFIHLGASIVDESWKDYHFISIRIEHSKLHQLASTPFVQYVEPVAPEPKTFNYIMRANTRANVLNADVAAGGEGLKGLGVTIGIGDDADPSNHVDLRDRVINRAAGLQNTHGTHVAGIAAGGGIKDPMLQGVAPLATIVGQLFNGIFLNAATYITDYHMMVTNNSWGNITGECDLTGVYDTYSKLMDDLAIQYPYLLNVFAAGNDGPFKCLGYPTQYHTIVSGHQSAKNVLSVGWGEKNQTVSIASSIGPTADGRLKPEITSQGSGVRSPIPVDDYLTDWGTSMAAPTVTGGAALLIEKFRQLNSGADPKSGLIKALLMNGAKDIENPAPDFKSGYGFLNLFRSVDILKKNRYFVSAVGNGSTNFHNITLPAGIAQLKVMVYWHDPAAAIFAQNALVNDVDLEVSTPASSTILPWILKNDSLNATQNATRGKDHNNNSEQVTIDNPTSGTYNINIKGNAINSGSQQEYFVVYDLVPTGVDLTYPSVGEPFTPGEALVINWDSWGDPKNTFTLQYSVDGGVNWIIIDNNIPATARQYNWNAPGTTDKCKLQLIKNGTPYVDESMPFVVLQQPSVSFSSVQCEDYININWTPSTGVTDYEVMMKKGVEMLSVTTTTNTNYIFSGLNRDSMYYVSVRARINGKPGRRAVAVNRKPDNGNCSGNISDNDLKIDSILSPASGRKFTSTEITTSNLAVRIKNLDDAPVTGFSVKYSVNGSTFISNNVTTNIPANGTYTHTFTGLIFSAAGDYNIVAVVKNNMPDPSSKNDTAYKAIRQIANPPITLPYSESFDATPKFEIKKDTLSLPGLDKWDFINTTDFGRVRSFVNTGIAKSANKAITLDVFQFTPSSNTNYLIGIFNLSNYSSTPTADIGLILEFSYKHHGQTPHPDNRVWARRSDLDPWIQIFNFDSLQLNAGEWKTVSINLSHFSALANPTSSFQLRFGQNGKLSMGDDISNAGITIDDVKLISDPYDIQMLSIESPITHSCNIGSTTTINVKFADHRGVSGCIPIKYRINNSSIISECAISTGTTNTYTFTAKPNFTTFGTYLLEVWTDHLSDTYHNNDTIKTIIYNKPVVTQYPYFENFENSTGFWHAKGYKSSWQYGTPSSYKINKAASGTKAWKTSLKGQYNENEQSYLYSPCFDVSSLISPYLSFNLAIDLEQCGQFICDKFWMEYSNDGKTWSKLGTYGQGINWYNRKTDNVWDSANHTNWHMAGITLPTGLKQVQFRFVLSSDAYTTREGVAIDDVQVFDQQTNSSNLPWRLFPNPVITSASLLTTHPVGSSVTIKVFNSAGQLVHKQNFSASGFVDNTSINMQQLASGVYAIQVDDGINQKVFRAVKH